MNHAVTMLLEQTAERFPERTALADENGSVTYREYRNNACIIAKYIQTFMTGGEVKRPIAVLIDRNIQSIIAFMGIAYSGNFYVPLDMTMPGERIRVILKELQPAGMIDCRGISGGQEAGSDLYTGRTVSYGQILSEQIPGDLGSDEEGDRAGAMTRAPECALRMIDTDPLYAIFTSGSTGIPKGVLVSHRSVLDLLDAFAEVFSFDENTVFGNQAPFDFDVSVKDIYNALKCGGRVEVIPKRMFVRPNLLLPYLAERKVNTLIWAVSAVRIVSQFNALDEVKTDTPLDLRYVMFSGEVMPVKALNYFMGRMPQTVFVNLYGPTEITCNCTYKIIDHMYAPQEVLPAGKAFPNTRILLLRENGEEIREPGVTGEICVEGSSLALGYYHAPDKTAESFCQHPAHDLYPNRIYRTGDLGYLDENGDLYFASRKDHQIKHMGHRIELGEIEAALNAIEWVDVSCCLYDAAKEKIICFYQAEEENRKAIVRALSEKLPKYMWPNRYVHMENMPLNAHGKIDRKALETAAGIGGR